VNATAPTASRKFYVGDHVEATWKGGTTYHLAKIHSVNSDGTYAVCYTNGFEDEYVASSAIREGGDISSTKHTLQFNVGDVIEATRRGGLVYFSGRIAHVYSDGTYSIHYDDGDKDEHVKGKAIRNTGGTSVPYQTPAQLLQTFHIGDRIEATYKGGSKYYSGRITQVNRDGTYSIRYDDGDKDNHVNSKAIRSTAGTFAPSSTPAQPLQQLSPPTFQIGDRIETTHKARWTSYIGASFHLRSRYYAGTITRVNTGGTYSIQYDDGDQCDNVKSQNIRKVNGTFAPGSTPAQPPQQIPSPTFQIGDSIEATYKGGSKYYPGQITQVNPDGTYSISYSDGDKCGNVKSTTIRILGQTSGLTRPPRTFQIGDRMEATIRGMAYYRGQAVRILKHDDNLQCGFAMKTLTSSSGSANSRSQTGRIMELTSEPLSTVNGMHIHGVVTQIGPTVTVFTGRDLFSVDARYLQPMVEDRSSVVPGDVVERGADCSNCPPDLLAGSLGSVCSHPDVKGFVDVNWWRTGTTSSHRWGAEGKYDLNIICKDCT
jgi:hypothetical protein